MYAGSVPASSTVVSPERPVSSGPGHPLLIEVGCIASVGVVGAVR